MAQNLVKADVHGEVILIDPDTGLSRFARYSADFLRIEYALPPTVHEWYWDFERTVLDLWDVRMWRLGYMLLLGEALFGEDHASVLDCDRFHESTPRKARYVCARFIGGPLFGLSFSHHEAVAKLDADERESWLKRAADEGWTRDRLRQELRDAYPSEPELEQPSWAQVEKPGGNGHDGLQVTVNATVRQEFVEEVRLRVLSDLKRMADAGPHVVRDDDGEPLAVLVPWRLWQELDIPIELNGEQDVAPALR